MYNTETKEITLDERVKIAISALQNIGDGPTEAELHPVGLSESQKTAIIKDHTLSVAKLQLWLDVLESLEPEDRNVRTELLQVMLGERILQVSQIISELQAKQ